MQNTINITYDKFVSYESIAKDLYKKGIHLAVIEFQNNNDNSIYRKLFLSSKIENLLDRKNYLILPDHIRDNLKVILYDIATYISLYNVTPFYKDNFYYYLYDLHDQSRLANFVNELQKAINSIKGINITQTNVIGYCIDI